MTQQGICGTYGFVVLKQLFITLNPEPRNVFVFANCGEICSLKLSGTQT